MLLFSILFFTFFECSCYSLKLYRGGRLETVLYSQGTKRKPYSSRIKDLFTTGRLDQGDVENEFPIDENQYNDIQRPDSKGFGGFIFNIESTLVDSFDLLSLSYINMAPYFSHKPPDKTIIKQSLGTTFDEVSFRLRWDDHYGKDHKQKKKDEENFYFVVRKIIQAGCPVKAHDGVKEVLKKILEDGNDIGLITAFPKDIAITLLRITGLAHLLEGRISINNLVTVPEYPDLVSYVNTGQMNNEDYLRMHYPHSGMRHHEQQYLRVCTAMQKRPVLTLTIERNCEMFLPAAKLSISTMGLRTDVTRPGTLQECDIILEDLSEFRMSDAYKLIRKQVKKDHGPEPATESVRQRVYPDQMKISLDYLDPDDQQGKRKN